jgi:hypothetical protein
MQTGIPSKVVFASIVPALIAVILSCGDSPSREAGRNGTNTLTLEEREAGWILLFDGETLNGWEDPAREDPPGDAWIVEDGCIKAVARPRLREDLFTIETFGKFEFVFEWKISPGGNSGVKYRIQDRAVLVAGKTNPEAQRFEDTVDFELRNRIWERHRLGPDDRMEEYVVAYEYQIIDNEGHRDAAAGADRQTGSIYGLVAPSGQTALPVGEFNYSRIVLNDNHVEHWLNRSKVIDTNLTSEEIRAGLEKRWTANSPVYLLLTEMPHRDTPIVLQHHNDEVWFRNLKIRRLD